MSDKIRFAILLYPHPNESKGWLSDVICSDGPHTMQAARPYEQAVDVANGELKQMFSYLDPQQVEVWTIHTSMPVASALKLLSSTAMFRRLDALEGDGVTVDRQTVRIR
ncbi:hypothetical protein KCV87_10020 [Actinosynnema pretiosum subsp. pretiosum]|uniref:Uncharacterized protein n=1 Tax=Actinosynnema pretiosum subsp. pretiosum TaxID=103721 RepID=A0AA45LAS5_9PSEU|nr:hypothetical protein APASM_2032 [Actinosynnema pretiosum subsp. pretiosum]QUF06357.1 hypothetical protein KCV87_10020 [Actinosynnema pretiosum subsp. pretiosum]